MTKVSAAVVLTLSFALPAQAEDDLAAEGRAAPMFRLPVYNPVPVGKTAVGLDQFVGYDAVDKDTRLVLLSFMASFCAPCKKEMPYLQAMHERYKDKGLRVMMVSIDTEPAGQKIIDDLIALNKVTFPVLKDRFNLVARRWLGNQSPLPSVFFLKPDGTITTVHRGYNEEASLQILAEVTTALGVKNEPLVVAPPAATPAPAVTTASSTGGTVVPASAVKPKSNLEMPPPPVLPAKKKKLKKSRQ